MFSMTRILKYAVGTKANGNRRVYIQNYEDLSSINFYPHARFDTKETKDEMVLKLSENGSRKVIESKRGDSIVELSDKRISHFVGNARYVSVRLNANEIRISIHHTEKQRVTREKNFLRNVIRKIISTASLYSGVGALTYTMHKGLEKAGFKPRLKFANEIDEIAAKLNANYNPIWDSATSDATFVMDDIETMDYSLMPDYVDHLEIAQPCTPYSKLTPKDKKDILHPITGKLFISTIKAISKMNPATLTIECTPQFLESNAYLCVADFLDKNGYHFETAVLKGTDYGDFEHRKRFALFAVSSGLKHLFPSIKNINHLLKQNTKSFKDIKDDIASDSPLFKEYKHVKARDDMKHLGYRNVLVQDDDTTMPALVATYASPKAGAPFIPHNTNSDLQRQITVSEHTKIRKFPKMLSDAIIKLGKGLLPGQTRTNVTAAHKVCGNSVSPEPWETLMFYMFSGLHNNNSNQLSLSL